MLAAGLCVSERKYNEQRDESKRKREVQAQILGLDRLTPQSHSPLRKQKSQLPSHLTWSAGPGLRDRLASP